jgi:hypothetical protein
MAAGAGGVARDRLGNLHEGRPLSGEAPSVLRLKRLYDAPSPALRGLGSLQGLPGGGVSPAAFLAASPGAASCDELGKEKPRQLAGAGGAREFILPL